MIRSPIGGDIGVGFCVTAEVVIRGFSCHFLLSKIRTTQKRSKKNLLWKNDDRSLDSVPHVEHTHVSTAAPYAPPGSFTPIFNGLPANSIKSIGILPPMIYKILQNKNTTDCHSCKHGSRGYGLTSAMIE